MRWTSFNTIPQRPSQKPSLTKGHCLPSKLDGKQWTNWTKHQSAEINDLKHHNKLIFTSKASWDLVVHCCNQVSQLWCSVCYHNTGPASGYVVWTATSSPACPLMQLHQLTRVRLNVLWLRKPQTVKYQTWINIHVAQIQEGCNYPL